MTNKLFLSASLLGVLLSSSAYGFEQPSHTSSSAFKGTLVAANADSAAKAQNFVQKLADRGIGFLSDAGLSEEQRTAEFRSLLRENFDMKTIGRFALGRYWKTSTDKEKAEYLKLFEEMIVKVYSRRFGEYNGQKLEIKEARMDGEADALVSSLIIPASGPEIKVDWRVRNTKGKMYVVDVIVEGVSMSMTQRADFASVIQRGGGQVEVLLSHLRGEEQ